MYIDASNALFNIQHDVVIAGTRNICFRDCPDGCLRCLSRHCPPMRKLYLPRTSRLSQLIQLLVDQFVPMRTISIASRAHPILFDFALPKSYVVYKF